MTTELFIVSYAKDLPYLEYCLRSIAKFASGFSGVTLLVPEEEHGQLLTELHGRLCGQVHDYFRYTNLVQYPRVADPAKWHLNAQMQKCHADEWCPAADFIAHIDSDCVFTEPVTPEDYFKDGKPVMCIESFARLSDSPWQAVTARALGFSPSHETMRRHPQVNPRGVYAGLRKHIEKIHGLPFDDYVLRQQPSFPWGFSEHNAIGAYARESRTWRDKYFWWDVGTTPWPPHKLMQFWSLSPPDVEQPLPSGGRGLPMNEFKRLGLA